MEEKGGVGKRASGKRGKDESEVGSEVRTREDHEIRGI